jgi:protein-disulfide isomerase
MNELDGVRVVQHNLPLDGACNPLVKDGHVGSCLMARYALAANLQGKYWEANELLFAKTPTNENDILLLLKEIKGLNITQLNKDANSEEIKRELKKEIDMALKKDIDATPTLIINMQKITGNVPFYDLKTKLLNSGAKEKKHD